MSRPKKSSRLTAPGRFLAELERAGGAGLQTGGQRFTWNTPAVKPEKPTGAPHMNDLREKKLPRPTSDIPLKPGGEVNLAAARRLTHNKTKKFNPK